MPSGCVLFIFNIFKRINGHLKAIWRSHPEVQRENANPSRSDRELRMM